MHRAIEGCFSQLTLQVEVRDPHAHYVNTEVEEGDFVLLQNVKLKVRSRLEGSMWPDQLNLAKVLVRKVSVHDTPEVEAAYI